ncbi:hypothetical protein BC831DRAFT_247734 [Entophlyctis helioformis]|nr:hypothetical protein BC831DRAFT_247734 [Entophlyctis helioformis]
MMAANTMLSWMEPPSLAAPVVLSSPARVGTPSGAAAAAAAAAGPGVFQSSVLASVGLDASGASGTFSPKTVAMGGDVPDAYAVYGALGGTLY